MEKLHEVQASRRPRPLFHEEGAGGVYQNDLTPAIARQIAAAFAAVVWGCPTSTCVEGDSPIFADHRCAAVPAKIGTVPTIVLASDGRAITAEVTAAVGEGLRFGGCDVIDVGPATAACLAFAIHHFHASGGILVGNPGREAHLVGLQFWTAGSRPLSDGAGLETIARQHEAGVDRPARNYGDLRRAAATALYLDTIRKHYHALRPLRVAIDSASRPLVEYLGALAATVACQVVTSREPQHDAIHFAASIDGDGEACRVSDEQDRAVPAGQLFLVVAGTLRVPSAGQSPCVVVDEVTSQRVAERLERAGLRVAQCGPRRADMAAAMSEHGAVLGGAAGGGLWHRVGGLAVPDALMTVTRLLELLSRSDEPLSTVLDRDAPLD